MEFLASPVFVIGYVLILNVGMRSLERKQIDKNTVSLIRSVALFPVILLLWAYVYQSSSTANPWVSVYLPLLSLSFLLFMVMVRILKFMKK